MSRDLERDNAQSRDVLNLFIVSLRFISFPFYLSRRVDKLNIPDHFSCAHSSSELKHTTPLITQLKVTNCENY